MPSRPSMSFILEREPQPKEARRARPSLSEETNSLSDLPHHAGNQAIQSLFRSGLVQASLAIGTVDDPAEHEADAIAAQVTSAEMPDGPKATGLGVQRLPYPGPSSPHVPGIVEQVLRSAGQPLDPSIRATFEPRFGRDFGHVRVHTSAEAAASARSINALAYTAGSDIVFATGQFSPQTPQGQHLLAHELTHVLQQRSPSAATTRRQADPDLEEPQKQITIAVAGDDIRKRVDDAVRAFYKLSGPGLTSRNVQFLEQSKFGSQLSNRDLETSLRYIFSFYGNIEQNSVPGQILDVYEGRILEPRPLYGYSPAAIDRVVHQGIKDGYFEYHSVPTIDEKGTQRIATRDLVTAYLHGVTDISGPRTKHNIKIETSDGTFNVATLVHEACHFYVSDAFRKFAKAKEDDDKYLGGAPISSILFEGFAEFFAAKVMKAHEDEFGSPSGAYPLQKEQAIRLAITLGEDSVEAAYFGGNTAQLNRLAVALEQYRFLSPDLLLPAFVVDSAPSGTSAKSR